MKAIRYYLLSFLSFLIAIIGFIGIKIAAIGVGIGFALLTEKYIGDWGLTLGWIIGLFVTGLLITGIERLSPYLEKLDTYTNGFKQYPYTEKYGINYQQPTPEDFGITPAEFKEYNSRFQFEFSQLLFTHGIWVAALIYVLYRKIQGTRGILFVGIVGIAALILHYLFEYWNRRISKRHRHYEKIHRFQESLNIYFKIRDENSII